MSAFSYTYLLSNCPEDFWVNQRYMAGYSLFRRGNHLWFIVNGFTCIHSKGASSSYNTIELSIVCKVYHCCSLNSSVADKSIETLLRHFLPYLVFSLRCLYFCLCLSPDFSGCSESAPQHFVEFQYWSWFSPEFFFLFFPTLVLLYLVLMDWQ